MKNAPMPDMNTMLRSLPAEIRTAATEAALDATAASVTRLETSTPGVSTVTIVYWLVRVGALVGGGFLLKWGIDIKDWTGETMMLVAGIIVTGGGLIWSFVQKQIQAWREHQIALASAAASAAATARAGAPVEVPVQPPPSKA